VKNEEIPQNRNVKNEEMLQNATVKNEEVKNEDKVEIRNVKIESESGDIEDALPRNFVQVWNGISLMRESRNAPVDTMGCDKFGCEPGLPDNVKRFHKLVACMLSSQTRDEANAACMNRLRILGLTVESMIKIDIDELAGVLRGVSFHNTKARNIKKVAGILSEKYDSDIPESVQELCKLPGVGPKMAHLVVTAAWGVVEGIPVDVHVHRITNRLGWVSTKTPEQTMAHLQQFLPR